MSSAAATTTSLQRAIVAIRSNNQPNPLSTPHKKKGDFEACFAGGLDLSEFTSSTRSPTAAVSHAAILLQRKQIEQKNRAQLELEDAQFHEAIQRKASEQQSTSLAPTTTMAISGSQLDEIWSPNSGTTATTTASSSRKAVHLVNNVVIGMHSNERQEEPRHKSKARQRRLPTATSSSQHRQQNKSLQHVKGTVLSQPQKKQTANKKFQRSKH